MAKEPHACQLGEQGSFEDSPVVWRSSAAWVKDVGEALPRMVLEHRPDVGSTEIMRQCCSFILCHSLPAHLKLATRVVMFRRLLFNARFALFW
jgi:hypothetical protein